MTKNHNLTLQKNTFLALGRASLSAIINKEFIAVRVSLKTIL